MKKALIFFLLLCCSIFTLNAERFQITSTTFNITGVGFKFFGKTDEYSILKNFPIDTKTVFENKDSFLKYVNNYEKILISSRFFDSVDIQIQYDQEVSDDILFKDESDKLIQASLNFTIVDSHHLLVLPYPKYSSNDGFTFKLKAKDTNFLGSLNTMNCEIGTTFSNDGISPNLSFTYDHPFKLGIFDIQWVNDYSGSYIIGNTMPEWNLKTGFDIALHF